MSAVEDRQRYERAKETGRHARRAGHKADRNPYRGASLRMERDAWQSGWQEADAEMRR